MLKFLIARAMSLPNIIYNYIILRSRNVETEGDFRINGRLFIRGNGKIMIGNNVVINSSRASNPIGGDTRTIFHCFEKGIIEIKDNVGISNCTIVCKEKVTIKSWVKIGGNVKIYDNDFHSVDYLSRRKRPDPNIHTGVIVIDEDAFIGAHSIILKGVHIGKRSIIAAGSVVTKNIPDDELWGGAPAIFIKKVNKKIHSIEVENKQFDIE